jgi:hypothetical protein
VDNSGLQVVRAPTDQPGAELEIDRDGLSQSNNTSIDLPQPTGGWKTAIKEVEYLCFYDTTIWPLTDRQSGHAVTLPAAAGPHSDHDTSAESRHRRSRQQARSGRCSVSRVGDAGDVDGA